ncbi:hypothetical protein MKX01_037535 [Papaver californicum]|nr:hypothetical protein MKX01_037535 [Papaver californicum]
MEHVFSWSIEDILNDDLYKHKVYLALEETRPLLEETRMEICSQMGFMSGVPHAEVTSVEESKLHGGSFLYCIKVDSWRNRYGVYGKEPYSPKPSDLFILGDVVPEVALDLRRFGSSWSLTSVLEEAKESDSVGKEDSLICFQVKTSKPIKIEMKEGRRKSLFVYRLLLQNEIITEVHVTEKIGTTPEVHTSVRKFAKYRFRALAVPLKRSIKILCTHLPLCGWLESFEILLSQTLNSTSVTLHKMRIEIVQVLRSVGHSLGDRLPSSTNRSFLTEFCLKNSSLIFSTVSSSYNLHECESVIPMQLKAIQHAVLIGDECHPQARLNHWYCIFLCAQIAAIENKVGHKYEKLKDFVVKVSSADGFYGGEVDVQLVYFLGKCFFNADEDEEPVKAMIKANKELDQLDNLLNEDSMLFKSAQWKVLFSNNFRKSFGKLKSSETQKSVVNLLVKLSNGWRPKKFKVESLCGNSIQLVKQYKVAKYSCYTQVLKIWDILPLEEMPKLVKSLDSIFSKYTDDYLNRCKLENLMGMDAVVPITWRIDDETIRYKNTNNAALVDSSSDGVSDGRCYIENSKVIDSLLLMKFYSLSAGLVNHLLSGSDGKELDLPFEKEQQYYFSSKGFVEDTGDISLSVPTGNVSRVVGNETKGTVLRQFFISSVRSSTEHNSIELPDVDDAVQYRDIPDSFRDIPPESSPLVITFQKFLMMLDGSTGNSYFDRFNDIRELSNPKLQPQEVNYERFSSSYWPHFNCQMTKKLDSSMVSIEKISHIKGGLFAGRLTDDKLRTGVILEYEKKKILNDEFDLADFVIDLHRQLKTWRYEGEEVDFVYIDEVQDFTMRQTGLFKYIDKRRGTRGFVFSGDTAQTIAGGVGFRFQEAISLFFSECILDSGSDGMGNAKDMDQSRISDIYQSVIELLHIFFPHHIDNLSPETSLIYGKAPIWLESANDDNAIIAVFGKSGENAGKSVSGFGTEQVILVRDDSARKEIAERIAKQALVLTIAECKGLEFQLIVEKQQHSSCPKRTSQFHIQDEDRVCPDEA